MTFNLSNALIGRPLMVEDEAAIRKLMEHCEIKADGFEMPDEEDDKEDENPIEVIDVKGTLIHSGPEWLNYFGYCTYSSIRQQIAKAAAAGKHVVLNVNSGGGEASGCFELADYIRSFRGTGTKIYGSANGYACSAAYELLAACERVYVSKYTKVGSIGVYAVHADQSDYDKKIGVKFTVVKAGEHKAELNPHEPLTGGAKNRLQELVNFDYQAFTASVASNRGISVDAVVATKADLMTVDVAVPSFADRIGELADAVRNLEMEMGSNAEPKAKSDPAENPYDFNADEVAAFSLNVPFIHQGSSIPCVHSLSERSFNMWPSTLTSWGIGAQQKLLENGWKMRCESQTSTTEHIEVDGRVIVSGCVAPYGKPSMVLPGGFREVYQRGCFANSIKGDVYADCHHDPTKILGRTTSGTLRFLEREDGLHYEIDMPDTSYSRDVQESMSRGDIKGSSSAFYLRKNGFRMEQRSDGLYRVITDAELVAISVVPKQAYPEADAKIDIQPKEAQPATAEANVPAHELELLGARLRLLELSN